MAGLVVHEWVAPAGGSENVVDQFLELFPDSDLQVLWSDAPERYSVPTYETWLARTPLRRHKALALPFLPVTWRLIKAHQQYDWMLVSSHLFAHHVHIKDADPCLPKFVYSHTPARYIWNPDLDQRGAGPIARAAAMTLKPLDRKRAQEATRIAANSEFTAERIRKAWGRDAEVIYPPVNTEGITAGGNWADHLTGPELDVLRSLPAEFLLGASRFVPYKRLGLVIEAGSATGLPVVLAGSGPQGGELRAAAEAARARVFFVDRPSDALLYALFQKARVYVFPAIEDFGIMPVEAMAAGTPVIVPSQGGAAESVKMLSGGAIIDEFTKTGWRTALDRAALVDRGALPGRTHALSRGRFRGQVASWVSGSDILTSVTTR